MNLTTSTTPSSLRDIPLVRGNAADGLKGGANAPTVYNSGFNIRQFWNGRAADLREQAKGPDTYDSDRGNS